MSFVDVCRVEADECTAFDGEARSGDVIGLVEDESSSVTSFLSLECSAVDHYGSVSAVGVRTLYVDCCVAGAVCSLAYIVGSAVDCEVSAVLDNERIVGGYAFAVDLHFSCVAVHVAELLTVKVQCAGHTKRNGDTC